MQPNPITLGETPAPVPSPDFGEGAAALVTAQSPLRDAQAPASERGLAAADHPPFDLAGARVSRVLRRSAPYASKSAGRRVIYESCKRGTDIAVSLFLLALCPPLFVMIAVLVKVSSPGPVFFRHRRLGLNGKEFDCLKFRTMVADAEERLRQNDFLRRRFEGTYKIKNDPRVTRVGAFLRRTSLDELPQLVHVLRGEMSLVGPRPIVRPELEKYSIYGEKLLTVKPGLSGLWQVCGRSDTTYPQRVMMDMYYIDHRCLSLDIRLLLHTWVTVLRKSGAW